MKNYSNKISKWVLLLVFVLVFQFGYGQQDPLYTNYMFNKLVYNPGYTGTNPEFICVTFLYHNQWTGFTPTEGKFSGIAPSTETFSIHGPFKHSKTLGGWGFYTLRDHLGFEENISVNISFSIKKHYTFGSLFIGINGGFYQRTIDNLNWIGPDGDVYDPTIPNNRYSDIKPDLGGGIYLFQHNRYFFGLSSQHVYNGHFNWGGNKDQFVRQSYISGGYSFQIPFYPRFDIQPSFLYKIDHANQQLDLNLNVVYDNHFWFGAQYRQGDAYSMLVGIIPAPDWRIGYSYDITKTNMNDVSNGTHEFFIQYCRTFGFGPPPPHIDRIIWTPRFL